MGRVAVGVRYVGGVSALMVCAALAAQAQDAPRRFGPPAASAAPAATPAPVPATPDPLAGSARRFGQTSASPAPASQPAPAARRAEQAPARTPAAGRGTPVSAPPAATASNWPLQPDPDAPVYIYQGKAHAPLRVAPYRWSAGQSFKRVEKGGSLPREFWLARYFVRDYGGLGLSIPSAGFEWVRFGPDVLMIDLSSGAVTEAIAGFFSENPNVADIPLNGG